MYVNHRRCYAEKRLDFIAIDRKWQQEWASQKSKNLQKENQEEHGKKNMYILPMFPYPSGHLHLGHLRVYTIADVLSRFRRMKGHNVLHPMGWDAFGLPAENAAIERGIHPAEWTKQNIANMKAQLQSMNGDWDWDREFATCDPKFYKHTQRLFLMLHERGLVYQNESLVNYDPVDKTVLANEQVDANGCSWRSGAKVEKRMLKQWFLRISEFRQALLDDLDFLSKDNLWPERVLSMQKNWIGKSEGARIIFETTTQIMKMHVSSFEDPIKVFTTRLDTLFGAQYLALAPKHPIVVKAAKKDPELRRFLDEILPSLPQDSKVGYLLNNIYGINPLSRVESVPDKVHEGLPIYVAPYVLGDYADGAVMGVPGHDARDRAFWRANCGDAPIRKVVQAEKNMSTVPTNVSPALTQHPRTSPILDEPFTSRGFLNSQCGPFSGQPSKTAAQNIIAMLNKQNEDIHMADEIAATTETWRLRDWLISRQRYWGTPIPFIHCSSCGPMPVPEDQLPIELPPVEGHWLTGKSGNPLEHAHDWINTKCPKCGSDAKRDTDTMDTFVDSSWYFMRFPDSHNENAPFSPESAAKNLPVDLYIGGVEHAILHLLYARFLSKFLSTTSLWPEGAASSIKGEPFKQVITQGMVHGKTYSDPATGRFLKPNEVDLSTPSTPKVFATGETANVSFEKMSKSKYNGVDPTTCFSKYGADATRAHILFQAPISEVLDWDEEKISGITRWLKKVYDRVQSFDTSSLRITNTLPKQYFIENLKTVGTFDKERLQIWDTEVELWLTVQRTILTTTSSFGESYALNTVVSDLMSLTNVLLSPTTKSCSPELQYHALTSLLKMMAPITPAFAEECWELLHPPSSLSQTTSNSIFTSAFPEPDGTLSLLHRSTQTCSVQINGKFKVAIEIPVKPDGMEGADLDKWVREQVIGSGKVARLGEVKVRKVIVVKGGKTINFVVS